MANTTPRYHEPKTLTEAQECLQQMVARFDTSTSSATCAAFGRRKGQQFLDSSRARVLVNSRLEEDDETRQTEGLPAPFGDGSPSSDDLASWLDEVFSILSLPPATPSSRPPSELDPDSPFKLRKSSTSAPRNSSDLDIEMMPMSARMARYQSSRQLSYYLTVDGADATALPLYEQQEFVENLEKRCKSPRRRKWYVKPNLACLRR